MNTFIKSLILAVAAFAVTTMSGCAVIPSTTEMNYTPTAHAQRIQNAGVVGVKVTGGQEDGVISYKRNGYGMKLAKLASEKPINEVVADAFNQELLARGFQTSDASNTIINVHLTKYFEDTDVHFSSADFNSDVDANVTVTKNNAQIFSKTIAGKGTDVREFFGVGGDDYTKKQLSKVDC